MECESILLKKNKHTILNKKDFFNLNIKFIDWFCNVFLMMWNRVTERRTFRLTRVLIKYYCCDWTWNQYYTMHQMLYDSETLTWYVRKCSFIVSRITIYLHVVHLFWVLLLTTVFLRIILTLWVCARKLLRESSRKKFFFSNFFLVKMS